MASALRHVNSNISVDENKLSKWIPILASLSIALVVFSPFLTGLNFPLWSTDNLFGSFPAVEMSRKQLLAGSPSWYPFTCFGIDFSASVNNVIYSPILRTILLPTAGATFVAAGILQFLCYWGIGLIQFHIAKHYIVDKHCALLAAIVYQISFATLYYLQTFPNIILQLFFLLSILTIINSKNVNIFLLIALHAISLTTMILTGHIVYSIYFLVANFAITCNHIYMAVENSERRKIAIAYALSIAITLSISQYRLIPFFFEVISGSRISQPFFHYALFVKPIAFFRQFIPELSGITIDKSTQLGAMGVSVNFPLSRFIDMQNAQLTFVNCGIVATSLMLVGAMINLSKFWHIISLFFLVEITLPWIVGTVGNAVFYPFQHGSHVYLASFFWSITAALTMANLKSALHRNKFRSLFTRFSLYATPLLAGLILSTTIFFASSSCGDTIPILIYLKLFVIVSAAATAYFSIRLFTKTAPACSLVRPGTTFNPHQAFITCIVSILSSLFLYFFATEVGRHYISLLILSIGIIGFLFPLTNHIVSFVEGKRHFIFLIIFTISTGLLALSYVIPLAPKIGNIDYPFEGYFRIANEYSRINSWPTEWLFIVSLSVYKLYLVLYWLYNILGSYAKNLKWSSVATAVIALAVAEQLPAFLEFTHYTSKPFVSVKYNELFKPVDNSAQLSSVDYRINNVHKALPINALFDYRAETEVLSNLPYAYGYNSYGGVNSQITMRQHKFLDAYVETRTTADPVLPNHPVDEIGLATNFTDKQLLILLGVKFNIQGQRDTPDPQPRLVATLGRHNIVHFRTTYYGVPQSAGNLDLANLDISKYSDIISSEDLNDIYCQMKGRGENVNCEPSLPVKPKLLTHELQGALSRFMLFSSYHVASNINEVARLVRDDIFDLNSTIIVEESLPFPHPRETVAVPLKFMEKNFDNISVEIEPSNDHFILLFNDSFNTGWQAFANGREIRIYPANGIAMAAILPPGTKTVELVFKPKFREASRKVYEFGIAFLLTLLTIGGCKEISITSRK